MRVAAPLMLLGAAVLLGVVLAEQPEHREVPEVPDLLEQREQREKREMTFRPMFVTRQRQRARQQQEELRRRVAVIRQRQRKRQRNRHARALQFPVAGEPGMALKVAVNDLLFQSAPANDLPDLPDAQSPWGRKGGALRPMLLARLRAAQLGWADRRMDAADAEPGVQQPEEEAEAFLLLSTDGGKPAIVPGAHLLPGPALKSKAKAGLSKLGASKRSPYKRVRRETPMGQTLLDMLAQGASPSAVASMVGDRARISERVKQYDMQGAYPAYSYTHGRYTRAAAATPAAGKDAKAASLKDASNKIKLSNDVKVKVKVQGDEDDEDMETAQTVVFRPLFVHRGRQAEKLRRADLRRRLSKGKGHPFRPSKVRAYPARYPQRRYSRPNYFFSPYRRVVYYH